jgi:predicted RNA binding protein YcfA (HicA-like mRNA interferase family)
MKRYDFRVKWLEPDKRRKVLIPIEKEGWKHVYAKTKEEAIKQLEMKGYKVVEDER